MLHRNSQGQALIEYLIIFLFISSLAFGLVGGFGKFLSGSFGLLGAALNDQLQTGVCQQNCHYNGYANQ